MNNPNGIEAMDRRKFLGLEGLFAAGLLVEAAKIGKGDKSPDNQNGTVAVEEITKVISEPGLPVITLSGIPESLPIAEVKRADGSTEHANTIGLGSEMITAEPGVILTDDDEILRTNTSALKYSPLTQVLLTAYDEKSRIGLHEGRFTFLDANRLNVKIPGVGITLNIEPRPKTTNLVVIRGLAGDNAVDTDRNVQMEVEYHGGFAHAQFLPWGQFWSEDQFKQQALASHNKNNCGDGGCSTVVAYFIDANTGACAIMKQVGPEGQWEPVYNNMV